VKLLDFGIAQVASGPLSDDDVTQDSGLTQTGTILGTAGYMSPEQTEAKRVDARSDIFSFGVVLYEMLSGRRAFNGDSTVALMVAVLQKEPEPLDAPESIRRVLARCLRKSRTSVFSRSSNSVRPSAWCLRQRHKRSDHPSLSCLSPT
jgi:serine/threonine protein kinase